MLKLFLTKLYHVIHHFFKQHHSSNSNVATASAQSDSIAHATAKTISAKGIGLIKSFEDLRLSAYDDGVGKWTIGFGTTIYPNGHPVQEGDVCTEIQAEQYLHNDLATFERTVNSAVKVPIHQHQFDALVSLTYNIGSNAFRHSTLLKNLNNHDYKAAAEQFDVWNRGGGRVLKGLVRRRQIEKTLFLT